MREILFKAKRKDNDEWVRGSLIKNNNTAFICREDYIPDTLYKFVVDPETLCQYTGLKDKNGKRIWENDILRGHGNNKDLSKVVFGEFSVIDVEMEEPVEKVVGWHTEVIETDELSKCEPFCLPMPLTDFYINRGEYEVIGNIFDNSELLKGELTCRNWKRF